MIDNVQFKINNYANSKDNILSFRWKKFYTLELMCTKPYLSKNYSFYTFTLINLKPVNIGSLEMHFRFYYNTCQNNTLFVMEYLLDKGIIYELFKEEFLDVDMNEICKNCQRILNSRKKENIHLSSIFFNSSKDVAWDIVLNLNKIKNINYLNIYDLEFRSDDNNSKNENRFKKGDSIIIKKKASKKIFAKLIVEEISEEKEKNEIIIKCEKLNGDKIEENNNSENKENNNNNVQIIEQKIQLIIKDIKKNCCYCEFKHIWNVHISDRKIKILNFLKNNSLNLLKKKIEENNELIPKYRQNTKSKNKEINKDDDINNESSVMANFFNLLCPINLFCQFLF